MLAALLTVAIAAPSLDPVVLLSSAGHTCAGTIISPQGDVLTAYHCVATRRKVRVETHDGARHRGRVASTDVARDLAVLSVPGLAGHAYLPTSGDAPSVGSSVWAMGHPYGGSRPVGYFDGTLRFSASQGVVSAVGTQAIQTTAPVNPGNSGGPLIDEDSGVVVGVVSRRIGRDGIGLASRVPPLPLKRGYRAIGGAYGLSPVLTVATDDDAAFSAGVRSTLDLRDRLSLRVDAMVPIDARWNAARFGSSSYTRAAATLALRQPLQLGGLFAQVDIHGGVAAFTTVLSGQPTTALSRQTRPVPIFGVALTALGGTVSADVQLRDRDAVLGVALVLHMPGVIGVF